MAGGEKIIVMARACIVPWPRSIAAGRECEAERVVAMAQWRLPTSIAKAPLEHR